MSEHDPLERTRGLIARELALDISEKVGDAYRDPKGVQLDGAWVGAFAQPGAVLSAVTAMSADIHDRGGAAIDEYGEAKLVILHAQDDRIVLSKQYAHDRFVYVGRLGDGVLAGYWYSPRFPRFGGVFWLAREDRLSERSLVALRARVRSTSPRRTFVKIAVPVLGMCFGFGFMIASLPLVLATGALGTGFVWRVRRSASAMRHEMELWKRDLKVSDIPVPVG